MLAGNLMKPAGFFTTNCSSWLRSFSGSFLTICHGISSNLFRCSRTIVRSLDHIATISEDIADLGRRHMSYDVEDEHYAILGEALLTMLNRLLGPDLTPEISDAWAAAYDMIARVMQESSAVPHSSRRVLCRYHPQCNGVAIRPAGRRGQNRPRPSRDHSRHRARRSGGAVFLMPRSQRPTPALR